MVSVDEVNVGVGLEDELGGAVEVEGDADAEVGVAGVGHGPAEDAVGLDQRDDGVHDGAVLGYGRRVLGLELLVRREHGGGGVLQQHAAVVGDVLDDAGAHEQAGVFVGQEDRRERCEEPLLRDGALEAEEARRPGLEVEADEVDVDVVDDLGVELPQAVEDFDAVRLGWAEAAPVGRDVDDVDVGAGDERDDDERLVGVEKLRCGCVSVCVCVMMMKIMDTLSAGCSSRMRSILLISSFLNSSIRTPRTTLVMARTCSHSERKRRVLVRRARRWLAYTRMLIGRMILVEVGQNTGGWFGAVLATKWEKSSVGTPVAVTKSVGLTM